LLLLLFVLLSHPNKIVILSEGGAFAAAVEGPAVAFAVAVACSSHQQIVVLIHSNT
jgi:hypothetical protein